MPHRDLIARRLRNQRLPQSEFRDPVEVVSWLGAVQAQEYPFARWGLGLRAPGLTDAMVEQAFDAGRILRTHVLRPTWHFVTPDDIRWMLALSGPRIQALAAYHDRQLELDAKVFTRSRAAITRALRGGHTMTRAELATVLGRAGIVASSQRLGQLMMNAELTGTICSGPRRGKQFTYALLDERAPQPSRMRPLSREEALAELTRRYFTSHGPATARDCAWWSGLTLTDVKAGIAMVRPALQEESVEGRIYWSAPAAATPVRSTPERSAAARSTARPASRASTPPAAVAAPASGPAVWLLPIYDEYLIAYRDRDPVVSASQARSLAEVKADIFANLLVVDGLLAGTWRRTVGKGAVTIDVATYARPSRAVTQAIVAEIERYGRFLEVPAKVGAIAQM